MKRAIFGASVCVLVWVALVVASPRARRSEDPSERHVTRTAVIPPGQEDLFAAMMGDGAALPDGCAFVSGQIEPSTVRGVYKCPGGEAVVELRPPSAAAGTAHHSEKIAIVPVGGVPLASLLAALEQRIRERESGFEWAWVEQMGTVPQDTAPSEAAASDAATQEVSPTSASSVCIAPPGSPEIFSAYVADCYPRFAAVLIGMAQTTVMVLGLGCGLVRLYRRGGRPTGTRDAASSSPSAAHG
jgi:hypothetical protein